MPYFRERTFPGVDGRLRAPLPVDTDNPVYESSAGQGHVDYALRYSHYIGDVDLGLSLFRGTSREPRLVPNEDGTAFLPHYDQLDQFGVDLQYTRDAWLWKLEAIARDGYSHSYAAAVGGFEYTFYQVGESAADIGLLLEYQYDGRNELEPITLNDNDLFVGTRLALNDTQDTSVLRGRCVRPGHGRVLFEHRGRASFRRRHRFRAAGAGVLGCRPAGPDLLCRAGRLRADSNRKVFLARVDCANAVHTRYQGVG